MGSSDARVSDGRANAGRASAGRPGTTRTSSAAMYSTRVARHINAGPAAVYAALLDPQAVARWRVPDGMTCEVHEFDGREGGAFRVSLSYDSPDGIGKSSAAHRHLPRPLRHAGAGRARGRGARVRNDRPGAAGRDDDHHCTDGGGRRDRRRRPPRGRTRWRAQRRQRRRHAHGAGEPGPARRTGRPRARGRPLRPGSVRRRPRMQTGTYGRAVAELRAGRKSTHWMWFVFPQIAGTRAQQHRQRFAISSLAEARAYLRHRGAGTTVARVHGHCGGGAKAGRRRTSSGRSTP